MAASQPPLRFDDVGAMARIRRRGNVTGGRPLGLVRVAPLPGAQLTACDVRVELAAEGST